jgi:outer membrane protein assembly factor BamB
MALDAATGAIVWQTPYPAPYKMNPATKNHGEGPKSTPLYYNGKLYTLGISGIVSAFDASNGKVVWQKPAPPVDPLFGTAMSAVADRGLVFFHVGGHNQGALTAFDANTGEAKWAWPGDGPAYGSPMIAELGGVRQLVTITQQKVIGLDISNGKLLWERPLKARADTNSLTPIIYRNMVIVSAQDAGTVAFVPTKTGNDWSTEVAWETKDVEMKLSNPVVVGDTLYGLSVKASGQYFALDMSNGKVLWLGKAREADNTALVKSGDILFLLNNDGQLTVAKANKSAFEPLQKYTLSESTTYAQPAIIGNRMFVKDASTLALWTLN